MSKPPITVRDFERDFPVWVKSKVGSLGLGDAIPVLAVYGVSQHKLLTESFGTQTSHDLRFFNLEKVYAPHTDAIPLGIMCRDKYKPCGRLGEHELAEPVIVWKFLKRNRTDEKAYPGYINVCATKMARIHLEWLKQFFAPMVYQTRFVNAQRNPAFSLWDFQQNLEEFAIKRREAWRRWFGIWGAPGDESLSFWRLTDNDNEVVALQSAWAAQPNKEPVVEESSW